MLAQQQREKWNNIFVARISWLFASIKLSDEHTHPCTPIKIYIVFGIKLDKFMIWQHTRTITVKIDDLTKNAEKLKKNLCHRISICFISAPFCCYQIYVRLNILHWQQAIEASLWEQRKTKKYENINDIFCLDKLRTPNCINSYSFFLPFFSYFGFFFFW